MNTYESLIEMINEIMNIDALKIDRDDDLSKIVNSLDFIKLLIMIESKLNITFEDEDTSYERLNSINAIVKYIDDKIVNKF